MMTTSETLLVLAFTLIAGFLLSVNKDKVKSIAVIEAK